MRKRFSLFSFIVLLGLSSPVWAVNMDVPGSGGASRGAPRAPLFGAVSLGWFELLSKHGLTMGQNRDQVGPVMRALTNFGHSLESFSAISDAEKTRTAINAAVMYASDMVDARASVVISQAENPMADAQALGGAADDMKELLEVYRGFISPRIERQLEQAQKRTRAKLTKLRAAKNEEEVRGTEKALNQGGEGAADVIEGPVSGQYDRVAAAKSLVKKLRAAKNNYDWRSVISGMSAYAQNNPTRTIQRAIVKNLFQEVKRIDDGYDRTYIIEALGNIAQSSHHEGMQLTILDGIKDYVYRESSFYFTDKALETVERIAVASGSKRVKDRAIAQLRYQMDIAFDKDKAQLQARIKRIEAPIEEKPAQAAPPSPAPAPAPAPQDRKLKLLDWVAVGLSVNGPFLAAFYALLGDKLGVEVGLVAFLAGLGLLFWRRHRG